MPSSSSYFSPTSSSDPDPNPDYQVDLDDDTAAAILPRPADAEGYGSFLRTQDEVDRVCKKYGVPRHQYTARPAGDLRASSPPPPGAVCVYVHALEAGMRVPLHPFFGDALAHFGLAPTQLAPNAWRLMAGFVVLCHLAGVSPPSVAVFRHFFKLFAFHHKDEKGWYYFKTRGSSDLRFTGLPHEIKDWKHGFFFLSSTSETPWPFPVEWGEPSKSSLMDPVLSKEDKKSAKKLVRAHGDSPVDLRTYLCSSNLAAAMISTEPPTPAPCSPQPPPSYTRAATDSKGMDPAVYDMMKTTLAAKAAAAQASASANKAKIEPGSDVTGSSTFCGKKRSLNEADGQEGPPSYEPAGACYPPGGLSRHIPSGHDGDNTDWEAARKRLGLQGVVPPQQERVFAASEPSDIVASSFVAILQAANYMSSSLGYALELEEKLVARDAEVAVLKKQLEKSKAKLAAAETEREMVKAELTARTRWMAASAGGARARGGGRDACCALWLDAGYLIVPTVLSA